MRRLLLAATAATCLSSPALALQSMRPGSADPRFGTFVYKPGEIYEIECTMLSTVNIILDADDDAEKGGTLNADPNAYNWESGGNMLVLTCKGESAQVRAHLGRKTILSAHAINRKTGERRAYLFQVTTRPLAKDSRDGMAGAQFVYPTQRAQERAEAARERAELAAAERANDRLNVAHYYGRRNRAYRWQAEPNSPGAALAQGLRVSDNGQTTTFEFRGNHSRAAIMYINEAGEEMTMSQAPHDGGTMILARVAKSKALNENSRERWVLRLGDAVLCLWNFDPGQPVGGYNPGTGTTDPNVIIRPKRRPKGEVHALATSATTTP